MFSQAIGPEDSDCSSITSVSLQYKDGVFSCWDSFPYWRDVDGMSVSTTDVLIEDVPK